MIFILAAEGILTLSLHHLRWLEIDYPLIVSLPQIHFHEFSEPDALFQYELLPNRISDWHALFLFLIFTLVLLKHACNGPQILDVGLALGCEAEAVRLEGIDISFHEVVYDSYVPSLCSAHQRRIAVLADSSIYVGSADIAEVHHL